MASVALESTLNTPELLIQILSHLPLRHLLLAQRVSRTWHDLISTTPALQKALYFHPASPNIPAPTHNPLLRNVFPAWFYDLRDYGHDENWPTFQAFAVTSWPEDPDAFRRKEASWRKMLVTQPPATRLVVEDRVQDRGADEGSIRTFDLKKQGGLTMGILYDVVQEWCAQMVESAFAIRWDNVPGVDASGEVRPGAEVVYKEQKWKKVLKEERPDTVTMVLYHSQTYFLQNLRHGVMDYVKAPTDFEKFRSEGAAGLETLECESREDISN